MSIVLETKQWLKNRFSEKQIRSLKRYQSLKFRGSQNWAYGLLFGSNLKILASLYGTDKWGLHWYAQHYESHFSRIRKKRLNILEIGIGGYENSLDGGDSLRMWRTYFPKSNIFGIDIYDKSPHNEKRIMTFQGSQIDDEFLDKVLAETGPLDIVIDDGSHYNEHVLYTFKYLFPKLQKNGIYVIEDIQTSYWQNYGGSSSELDRKDTTMGFLKQLCDGINYLEIQKENEDFKPNYYDSHISSICLYHNIAFLKKKK